MTGDALTHVNFEFLNFFFRFSSSDLKVEFVPTLVDQEQRTRLGFHQPGH